MQPKGSGVFFGQYHVDVRSELAEKDFRPLFCHHIRRAPGRQLRWWTTGKQPL